MKQKTFLKVLFVLCAIMMANNNAWGQVYKKITTAQSDWSGEYLIVSNKQPTMAYDGSKTGTDLSANGDYITIKQTNNVITGSETINKSTFIIAKSANDGKYTIKSKSGYYIGRTANSNGLDQSTTTSYDHTITMTNGTLAITSSGGPKLQFLNTKGSYTFKYYKTDQSAIELFKLAYTVTYDANTGTGTMTDTNSPYFAGSTVTTKTNTFEKGGYEFAGWNTKADGSGTSYDEGDEFTLNGNTTLYAQWTVASTVAAPTFSVAEGTYNTAQSVEINCSTPSSTIYYTLDGTDPTTSSTVYTSAIAVDATTTIKAFAVADGLDDSGIASATYTLKCATPTITIPEGVFVSTKNVTIAAAAGTTISYSTDNGDNWSTYSAPFAISATTTVKAKATKTGWTDSEVASETFTKETVLASLSELVAKTNTSDQSYYVNLTNAQVTYVNGKNGYMEDANSGIYIYNITPTKNKVYNGIFQITYQLYKSMPELKAITAVEGTITDGSDKTPAVMTASDLKDNFTANLGRQIKIVNHTTTTTTVLITGVDFYTTYYKPSFVKDNIYTITGYPYNNDGTLEYRVISAVAAPAAPVADFAAGEFSDAFTLHLSCETDGAVIYYTTNGDEPTTSSTLYTDGIAIPAATTTVKAISYLEGMSTAMDAATYTYKAVAKPYFTPVTATQVYYGDKVEVACATEGSAIYYTLTTDESEPADPTSASTAYPDGGIAITANTVKIKAIAKVGDDYSSVAEATYTLKDPEVPTFDVAAGAVARNTVVTISSREGTTIYYTTNGDNADTGTDAESNSVQVTIDNTMTIKAIAVDPELNMSSEVSASYTIAQVATPVIDTAAGMLSKGTLVHITTATDGASIYYTLDGTTPTASSNPYNGYVVISKAETLKAIAIKENYIDSEIASVAYTVAGDNEGFVFKDLGYKNAATVKTVSGTDVQLEFADGTNKSNSPSYYDTGEAVRLYQNNTLTISSEAKTIIAIRFTFVSGYATLALSTGQPGTLSDVASSQRTWTGSASSIQFTTSAANRIKSITVYFALSDDAATVGSSKLAGYCSEYKLDYSETGLKAYKAKVDGEGNVVLTQIADGIVPANEGVILSGNADDYNIPISTADVTADFSDNEMVGVTQRTLVEWTSTDGKHNYILQQGEFNKATDGYLKPNRAYLHTTFDVSASPANKMTIIFNDSETDGIRSIENGKLNIETSAYNLSGQRVGNDYKGFVIINGKKVIRK
ncbi:MAG: chitobiase/beta-hexosaminidase C-terminal domain-containing protein [Prevotella sp.]|nr:chitobiase/beta-hexosaminidase C-terminal domain-containing protein [Prevotella sp.]